MTPFATQFWKEWRGERRSIIYLAAVAALLPGLGLAAARQIVQRYGMQRYTYDGSTATIVAQSALLAVALTVGAELVPGESRRGTIALLRRLPCGLLKTFGAKVALLLATAFAIALFAWLSACVAIGATGGPWFPRFDATSFLVAGAPSLLLVSLLGGWTIAASTWLSRATLALPAAALALALTIAPLGAIAERFPGLLLRPRELAMFLWCAALAAPIVAALSFVIGRRHGGGERRSLAIGLAALLTLSVPAYGWISARVAEWGRIDPFAETFRFTGLSFDDALSDDGRYAYVTVNHEFGGVRGLSHLQRAGSQASDGDGPAWALQVDLTDGSWSKAGPPGSVVMEPNLDSVAAPARYVRIVPFDPVGCELAISSALLDARSGVELAREPLGRRSGSVFDDRPERLELDRSFRSTWLPDGRQVWHHRGEFVTTMAEGAIRTLPDSATGVDSWVSVIGLGAWIPPTGAGNSGATSVEIYDFGRERRYPLPPLDPQPTVRVGRWIVTPPGQKTSSWEKRPFWALYDPDTGITTPAPAAVASDMLCWFDDDGAALGGRCNEQGWVDELFRIDPELGTRERVALPEWLSGSIYRISVAARTNRGTPILRVCWAPQGLSPTSHFARWDRAQRQLLFAADGATPQTEPIGCPDEETLLAVEDQRRLVRLRFGSAARELVFPTPDTKSEALR